MDYRIVEASTSRELDQAVRALIVEGWEPLGGVAFIQQLCDSEKHNDNSCTLYDAGFKYAQAMIRREVKTNEESRV